MDYTFQRILFANLLAILILGCSTFNSSEKGAGFSVKLVDAPGDYKKVLVDVQAIEVVLNGKTRRLPVIEPGVYNLLELTGGVSAKLVETVLPAGRLSQMKLVLGEENKVVKTNGEYVELFKPKDQQDGLTVKIQQDMESNILYDFILDFNVERSIVPSKNGENLLLRPVIRTTLEAQGGGVTGVVNPGGISCLVSATIDEDTEVAAYTAEDTGVFYLYGVPEGSYTMSITPNTTSGLSPVKVKNIVVKSGKILDLGVIGME